MTVKIEHNKTHVFYKRLAYEDCVDDDLEPPTLKQNL